MAHEGLQPFQSSSHKDSRHDGGAAMGSARAQPILRARSLHILGSGIVVAPAEVRAWKKRLYPSALPRSPNTSTPRTRMGWGRIDEETANRTIQSAAFTVGLRRQDQLVVGPRDGRWRDVFLSG